MMRRQSQPERDIRQPTFFARMYSTFACNSASLGYNSRCNFTNNSTLRRIANYSAADESGPNNLYDIADGYRRSFAS
jgi:hypothetical protein